MPWKGILMSNPRRQPGDLTITLTAPRRGAFIIPPLRGDNSNLLLPQADALMLIHILII